MSATAAQSINYILIPGAGGFPSVLSGSEAQSRITAHNDDLEQTSRFSELLEQRNLGHVPYWLAGGDVIVRGDMEVAWAISDMAQKFPNMMPSALADNDNAAMFAPREDILGDAFTHAASNVLRAPNMGVSFKGVAGVPAAANRNFAPRGRGLHAA